MVWVTGLGLAVGLAMIVALLILIIANGLTVFWPRRVALIELTMTADATPNGSRIIGEILSEQPRVSESGVISDDEREWRVFVGNRDVYGQSYDFVPQSAVETVSYPDHIIRAERREFGDALFIARALVWDSGERMLSSEPGFRDAFERLVRDASRRRREISRIERYEIGRINERMRRAQLDTRYLSGITSPSDTEQRELEEALERIRGLDARFEPLAARARELRAANERVVLEYELAGGRVLTVPTGAIFSYYYPNELNLIGRIRLCLNQIWRFVSEHPREANTEGGILPAILGTFMMTLLMSIAVMPFGVVAAIYLREYAGKGTFVRVVRIGVNNLAGIPSIVYGIFGLGFFVHVIGGTVDSLFFARALPDPTFKTGGLLWASLTLALMTLPVVIVATEESLAAIPVGVREGSLAVGASKWHTIWNLVLPAAAPGIMTGLILAMARGAGEVAPLILVGVVALAPNFPVDRVFPYVHAERKFMHLGFHIYDLGFQSPDSEAAQPAVFATTLVLILIVVVLNLTAIRIRSNLRKRNMFSAF